MFWPDKHITVPVGDKLFCLSIISPLVWSLLDIVNWKAEMGQAASGVLDQKLIGLVANTKLK